MKIKVIGKAHLEGKSKKTGKDYNFNQIHYLGVAYGVDGQAALTQNLDPARVPYDSIVIGAEYAIEFDNRGYVVSFERVTAR